MVNVKDNSKRLKIIREMYDEIIKSKDVIECPVESIEAIRLCEKNNTLVVCKDDETCIGFVKTKGQEGKNYMRIIFAVKDGDKKGRKNTTADVSMDVIKDVESVLLYVDSCKVTRIDNRIYVDFLKQI